MRNLGLAGWAIAILVVTASGLFSNIVTGAATTHYNVPLDWTFFFMWSGFVGAVGVGLFYLACRVLINNLPVVPNAAPQKG